MNDHDHVANKRFGQAGSLTVREHINNHTMLEAMANGYYEVQQQLGRDSASEIEWSATYSESGWTGSITGTLNNERLTLNYTATTVYDDAQNATSTFSATGVHGRDTITINGTSAWIYDARLGGYKTMIFQDHGTVDPGSQQRRIKWWVAAAEAIGGGILGGALGGVGGAVAGAGFGIACSAAGAARTVDGSDPPFPGDQDAPALPTTVDEARRLVPNVNQIITRVLGDRTENANVRNRISLAGNWASGRASGTGRVHAEG
ncbi:hypothetical protein predicted by Glimmer/Critica [Sorangium cellulosum So ce56]|uniref:Uncharacterized protein n=1 Tax=Sorangium cellulosum (strain So ce56) TaxID=448385 RepID=A9GK30_SORC5|nr:hypothetical protein [Sorangium cellulosum]CAN96523.1 hypothetical protein predicted by Glimmer/Critica [Sorangium cellulosum So ce56]